MLKETPSELTLVVASKDTNIATISIFKQDVDVTGITVGKTLIYVSIPYEVKYVYEVIVV